MTAIRSVVYGYLGAVIAGVVVAAIAAMFGVPTDAAAKAAVPAGVVFGTIGLLLPLRRAALVSVRERRRR
jgi:energy-converting hydrogenase Eha subunit A